jgi:hypothetical protein
VWLAGLNPNPTKIGEAKNLAGLIEQYPLGGEVLI